MKRRGVQKGGRYISRSRTVMVGDPWNFHQDVFSFSIFPFLPCIVKLERVNILLLELLPISL